MADSAQKLQDDALALSLEDLRVSEHERLSYALFPETHTNLTVVLGKQRILHPVPLATSRKIHALMKPYIDSVEQSQKDAQDGKTVEETEDEVVARNEQNITYLKEVVKELAKHYGSDWDDVKKACDEDQLSLVELEDICNAQQHLNSANDFFLNRLRMLLRTLQIAELFAVRRGSLENTSILLRSSPDASAVSTTSSETTPGDS